jgi:hypothetical protein
MVKGKALRKRISTILAIAIVAIAICLCLLSSGLVDLSNWFNTQNVSLAAEHPATGNYSRQIIILKADDFQYTPNLLHTSVITQGWSHFIAYIEDSNLQASIGIIGNSLEMGSKSYLSLIRAIDSKGNIEFWNHGYTHALNPCEFQGSPYEYQLEHLLKTQKLAREKLGITLHTFGAPGGATDSNTSLAITNTEDIKFWLNGDPSNSKSLPVNGRLERTVGQPDFQYFLDNYDSSTRYLIYTIHPKQWGQKQFDQFELAVDYLLRQQVTFATSYEYYKYLNGG